MAIDKRLIIQLTDEEKREAAGVARRRAAVGEKLKNKRGLGKQAKAVNLAVHMRGTSASVAFGKLTGLQWTGPLTIGVTGSPAFVLSDGREVQTRGSEDVNSPLLIEDRDRKDRHYVQLAGDPESGRWMVIGWIEGERGKDEKYRDRGRYRSTPFAIPREDLNPMNTFPGLGWLGF